MGKKVSIREKQFFSDILSTMHHLNSTILTIDSPNPFSDTQSLLNDILNLNKPDSSLFTRLSQQISDETVYFFYEQYFLNFCILKFPFEDEFFFIGPYLTEEVTEATIEQLLISQSQIRSSFTNMRLFYQQLPVIGDNVMTVFMNQIAKFCYGGEHNYQVKRIKKYLITQDQKKSILLENPDSTDFTSMRTIEKRYENENKLLQAVSIGNKRVAIKCLGDFKLKMDSVYEDSLEERKNRLVIFNTLLRKSMEASLVHPFYIDRLSRKCARDIRNIATLIETDNLEITLVRRYCDLVRKHSFPQFSPVVRDTINLINIYSNKKYEVKELAKELNVNTSYLSQLFKKETGETIISYITNKKVVLAKKALIESNYQIQEVAYSIGIFDINQFTKFFKKNTGYTPSNYRKKYRNF